jgi:hypothetical protein
MVRYDMNDPWQRRMAEQEVQNQQKLKQLLII